MKILVTLGGTREPIDNVRSITNTSTGRLGSLIVNELSRDERADEIFVVCPDNAVRPDCEKARIIRADSSFCAAERIKEISENYRIDAVIHSMAVSDYTAAAVFTADELDCELKKAGEGGIQKALAVLSEKSRESKISSALSSPMILLKQTPKIIGSLRGLFPDSVIVGFKLLSNVSREELFDTARRLLISNNCDLVLANDSSTIHGEEHTGFLLDKDECIGTFFTKQEIARGVAFAVLERAEVRT